MKLNPFSRNKSQTESSSVQNTSSYTTADMKVDLSNDPWTEYKTWLKHAAPTVFDTINPAPMPGELSKLTGNTEFTLPDEVIKLYEENDGGERGNLIYGMELLSIAKILNELQNWRELEDVGDNGLYSSYPENAIKLRYTNHGWLPLLSDGSGNHIGVDMDPGPNGLLGQVINFGRDEDHKFVIASSFTEFLKMINSYINAGRWVVNDGAPSLDGYMLIDALRIDLSIPALDGQDGEGYDAEFVTASYGSSDSSLSAVIKIEDGKITEIRCPEGLIKVEIEKSLAKLSGAIESEALKNKLPKNVNGHELKDVSID